MCLINLLGLQEYFTLGMSVKGCKVRSLIPCGVIGLGPIIEGLTLGFIPCGVTDLGSIIEGFDRQYV